MSSSALFVRLLAVTAGAILIMVACQPLDTVTTREPDGTVEARKERAGATTAPAKTASASAASGTDAGTALRAATVPAPGDGNPETTARGASAELGRVGLFANTLTAAFPQGFETPPATDAPGPDSDFPLIEASAHSTRTGVGILQIGDSHTAADFFTGAVRQTLQARYGNGGLGYLEVGRPHPGVHKTDVVVKADAGWSYSGIQQSTSTENFALSGFLAQTGQAGQSLTFAANAAVPYTDIDIEVEKGPEQGTISVLIDGRLVTQASLNAADRTRAIIHVPPRQTVGSFRRLELRTIEAKPVTVLSVNAYNRRYGLTYSNIGFPGATIDILNKFPRATLIEALNRLVPRVVVLSFGTNEGFNDNLDLARYRERYENVIRTIRNGAPSAHIVMILPPFANRVPANCQKDPQARGCNGAPTGDIVKPLNLDGTDCHWPTPPQLDRVRSLQRDLAKSEGIAFWDWTSIMPTHCGPEAWASMVPRRMTQDRVHFTVDGYKIGGEKFSKFLIPYLDSWLQDKHAVSNN